MKTIIIMLIVALAACNHPDSFESDLGVQSDQDLIVRAKVVENNTITYCVLTPTERKAVRSGDTVWLDLGSHRINDTADNTMRAVLYR
jgi:hypothetical protein